MNVLLRFSFTALWLCAAITAGAQHEKHAPAKQHALVITLVAVPDAGFPIIGSAEPNENQLNQFGTAAIAWLEQHPEYKTVLRGNHENRTHIGTDMLAAYGEAAALDFKQTLAILYPALIRQHENLASLPPSRLVFLISDDDYKMLINRLRRD